MHNRSSANQLPCYSLGNIKTGGTVTWNTTTANSTTTSLFYIVTTADSYYPIGFLAPNGTAPTGFQTIGFTTYGTEIAFIAKSTLQSQFWASKAGVNDTWVVRWNENGAYQDGSVPVTLKTVAPTTPSA
jgi:hypothetical protein